MNDEQQNPEPQSTESQTPGQILRAAREFCGYQQAGVAERLRLSVQTIIDIENDDYTHFTAEIYLRGHIRSYARLCNVDSAIVLKAYENMDVKIETDPHMPVMLAQDVPVSRYTYRAKRKTLLWVGLSVLLLLIVMVMLWWQEQHHHTVYSQKAVEVVTPAAQTETLTMPPKPAKKAVVKKSHSFKKIRHKKTAHFATHKLRTNRFMPDYSITPVKR